MLGTPCCQGQAAKLRGRGTRQPEPSLTQGKASSAPHHLQLPACCTEEAYLAALSCHTGIT